MRVDAFSTARRYIAAQDCGRHLPTLVEFELDTEFCIRPIADWFEDAPDSMGQPQEREHYENFKEETDRQFEAMREAGVEVLPWLDDGQPYSGFEAPAARGGEHRTPTST